jgi:hypothetical protein
VLCGDFARDPDRVARAQLWSNLALSLKGALPPRERDLQPKKSALPHHSGAASQLREAAPEMLEGSLPDASLD